jgi:protein O-GlcNAc transferase
MIQPELHPRRIAARLRTFFKLRALLAEGIALHQAGRLADAEQIYYQVLTLKPNHFDSLHFLAVISSQRGNHPQALEQVDLALIINPDSPFALNNRGVILYELKRYEEALASYDRALALQPDYAEAHSNRGNALKQLKRHDEALASYDRALALRPDYAEALANRANTYKELKQYEDALASYDRALILRPNYAEALANQANCLWELNRCEEAVASYEKAIALKPDYGGAQLGLCMAELPILYADESEIVARRKAYERRLRALCEVEDRSTNPADLAQGIGHRQPFFLAYQGYNDRELQSVYGSFACRLMAKCYPSVALAPPPSATVPVRVGFVSGYFRNHSNWKLRKGWLSQLDRQRFRIFGYHTGVMEDEQTQVLAALCDRFVQGPLTIENWRREISADAPHVLIYPELGMDPVAAALAAQRLAPVQCCSFGHPDTTGFPTVDYYLTSDLMEPSDGKLHYTEHLVRLPNLSMYLEPIEPPAVTVARPDLGLRSTAVVYWCGQSLFKYLPQFDEVFSRIARAVGDCQFAFIQHPNGPPVTDVFRRRLDRAFAKFGLNATEHCCFLPRLHQDRFLAATGVCDVFLDSIYWSGFNSTLESLPYNLPIVTMAGPLMRGRHSMAILTMMGVTDTIAQTTDEYVSVAIRLGQDAAWRQDIKAKIASNKHRIYRDRDCVAGLEQFLDRVVRTAGIEHCA